MTEYSPELLALRSRVINGNEKLFQAWLQIREIAHDSEEWSRQMELWHQAAEKLSFLCSELKLKNFTGCLYIENGEKTKSCLSNPDGFFCQVCPSARRYFEEEMASLPGPWRGGPKAGQTKGEVEQAEFLETLGGK